jgi:hypothetical protein
MVMTLDIAFRVASKSVCIFIIFYEQHTLKWLFAEFRRAWTDRSKRPFVERSLCQHTGPSGPFHKRSFLASSCKSSEGLIRAKMKDDASTLFPMLKAIPNQVAILNAPFLPDIETGFPQPLLQVISMFSPYLGLQHSSP